MWENSRVIHNRRYHPFLWSWYIVLTAIGLYVLVMTTLFVLSERDKKNPGQKLFEKTLETRRSELVNFKLGGLEPYAWKPMFDCHSLEDRRQVKKTNRECIRTSIAFVKKTENIAFNQFAETADGHVERFEQPGGPCLICHSKQSKMAVRWSFDYQVEKQTPVFASIWGSPDFLYLNIFVVFSIALYLLLRFFFRVTRANDLIAVAVKTGRNGLFKNINEAEFRSKFGNELKMFLYIEITENFVAGYVPRRYLMRLYKKYFTGEFDFTELDLRIGVVEYNSLSFEGLRIAQGIASRAQSSNVIMQDKVLSITSGPEVKKAVLKKKDARLEFNVIDFKKDK